MFFNLGTQLQKNQVNNVAKFLHIKNTKKSLSNHKQNKIFVWEKF
jgi:hypothetical protein